MSLLQSRLLSVFLLCCHLSVSPVSAQEESTPGFVVTQAFMDSHSTLYQGLLLRMGEETAANPWPVPAMITASLSVASLVWLHGQAQVTRQTIFLVDTGLDLSRQLSTSLAQTNTAATELARYASAGELIKSSAASQLVESQLKLLVKQFPTGKVSRGAAIALVENSSGSLFVREMFGQSLQAIVDPKATQPLSIQAKYWQLLEQPRPEYTQTAQQIIKETNQHIKSNLSRVQQRWVSAQEELAGASLRTLKFIERAEGLETQLKWIKRFRNAALFGLLASGRYIVADALASGPQGTVRGAELLSRHGHQPLHEMSTNERTAVINALIEATCETEEQAGQFLTWLYYDYLGVVSPKGQ